MSSVVSQTNSGKTWSKPSWIHEASRACARDDFEALFTVNLHQVTARIHETENLEQIMLEPAKRSASY